MPERHLVLATVSGSALLLLLWAERKRRQAAQLLAAARGGQLLPLLPSEVEYGMHAGRPGFVTLYEGVAPLDVIREQVEKIVAANPWVAGRLRTSPYTGKPTLWVPEKPDVSECFLSMMGSVDASLPGALYCKGGFDCLDSDAPLFKVGVLSDVQRPRFILVVSLCHAVGDGATIYNLYGMLKPGAQVMKLEPEREMAFVDAAVEINGADGDRKQRWLDWRKATGYSSTPLVRSVSPQPWMLRLELAVMQCFTDLRTFCGPSSPPSTVHVLCRFVNLEEAAKQKQECRPSSHGVPWVSTNDVVSSWFMRAAGRVATMVVNLRPHLPFLRASYAGNYVMEFAYFPDEMSPESIRRSLTELGTKSPHSLQRLGRAPGAAEAAPPESMKASRAHITSWASFFRDVNFDGCTQLCHWPNVAQLLRSDIRSQRKIEDWDDAYNVMMVFKPTKETLAAVILSSDTDLIRRLQSDPLLGAEVSDLIPAAST